MNLYQVIMKTGRVLVRVARFYADSPADAIECAEDCWLAPEHISRYTFRAQPLGAQPLEVGHE